MAHLPSPTAESSEKELTKNDKVALKLGQMLAMGVPPTALAKQLSGGDPKRAKHWRKKIQRLAEWNPHMQEALARGARARMMLSLVPASDALAARAMRGRPDAVKLLWAATGFHNDKVQHDHSGEIKVAVTIPRPDRTVDQLPEPVVDADVVED